MKKCVYLFLLLFLLGCNDYDSIKEIPISQIEQGGIIHIAGNAPVSKEFGYEALLLYNITEKSLIENINHEFVREDSFGFVVYQLKGMAKDQEGYSWYDVGLQVKDQSGNVVIDYQSMLGSSGKLKLQKDTISVYGNITIPSFANLGEYQLAITVHDRIALKTFIKTAHFTVH